MEELRENLKRINERIAEAASRVGRKPEDVQLVAVTKTVETERIREGIEAGLKVLGENRVQEAEGKILELGHGAQWHMIGHLQTNKVKKAVRLFDMIHSVDSLHLAFEIEKRASALGKQMPILLQVDLAEEETKSGFSKEELFDALPQMAGLAHIKICGVMTIPPFSPDPEASRPYFRELSDLREKIAGVYPEGIRMDILSMGMSQDFEVAIQEGANMVRIGTALFGPRCCKKGGE
jgi:pyridoxal phosphate enzyme (YggS family)